MDLTQTPPEDRYSGATVGEGSLFRWRHLVHRAHFFGYKHEQF
jgi:hypothetical protein